jgi:hypothetical protein
MEYTVKIFPDPEGDGDYIAQIEELKGCSAFGETPERQKIYGNQNSKTGAGKKSVRGG